MAYLSRIDFIIDGVLQKRQMISNEGTVHPMLQYIHVSTTRITLAVNDLTFA